MLIIKHLETLQHVSIIIQIIFRELAFFLLKLSNLKFCSVCERYAGLWSPSSIPLAHRTHTHQTLYCSITTFDLLHS